MVKVCIKCYSHWNITRKLSSILLQFLKHFVITTAIGHGTQCSGSVFSFVGDHSKQNTGADKRFFFYIWEGCGRQAYRHLSYYSYEKSTSKLRSQNEFITSLTVITVHFPSIMEYSLCVTSKMHRNENFVQILIIAFCIHTRP